MKNFISPKFIRTNLLVLILFTFLSANAQEKQTKVSNKAIAMEPFCWLQNKIGLSFDFFIYKKHRLIASPMFMQGKTIINDIKSPNVSINYKMTGLGLELRHRIYRFAESQKGLFWYYALGFNSYSNKYEKIKDRIYNFNLKIGFGYHILLKNNVFTDIELGTMYRSTKINLDSKLKTDEQTEKYNYNTNILSQGYTGIIPTINIRIGLLL